MASPMSFRVDYYYKMNGSSGRGARTQLSGSVGQNLNGGTTESAVLEWLRKRHSGCEITLMKVEWK